MLKGILDLISTKTKPREAGWLAGWLGGRQARTFPPFPHLTLGWGAFIVLGQLFRQQEPKCLSCFGFLSLHERVGETFAFKAVVVLGGPFLGGGGRGDRRTTVALRRRD